ncbi:calcium-binding protein [Shimia thalassica]|uniref:calcium-binding protein n=2 Tax=Shimia thalassica TaxID=1715693 RepID=UPI0032991E92
MKPKKIGCNIYFLQFQPRVQIMPHIFANELLVNDVTVNDQSAEGVSAVGSNRLLFTYASFVDDVDQFGRIATVSSSGSMIWGNPFLISEGTHGTQINAQPWGTTGPVLFSYSDLVPLGVSLTTTGSILRSATLNGNSLDEFGEPYTLTDDNGAEGFRLLASDMDGNFISLFSQNTPSGSGETNYLVQGTFDDDAITLGDPLPIAETFVYGGESEGDAAIYNGSMLVSVWYSSPYYGDGFSARLIGFDESGFPSAGPTSILSPTQGLGGRTTSVSLGDDIEIERLADGTLVVVYEQHVNSSLLQTDEIAATIVTVNADSTLSFGQTSLIGGFAHESDLKALALTDGRLLVAWQSSGDVFASVGTPMADGSIQFDHPFIVNQETRGDQGNVSLAQLPDGRVAFYYSSTDWGLGDFSGTSAVTRIMTLEELPSIFFSGTTGNDTQVGGLGNDRLDGAEGDDELSGAGGRDTLIGGGGDDTLMGGDSENDLRDVIYGGDGDDSIDGGYGNDELRGDAGHDTIAGGFGADTVIGGTGNDTLTGSAYADQIFGGDGDDFVNGGFGHDLLNGGDGADRFFHIGVSDHGSDWVQDYDATEGDVLQVGIASATSSQFQINTTHTATAAGERSGDDDVEEAFVIYRPTGQILWALVDGGGQSSINLQIGGEVFDLMS